jgi:hypothetical protein
VLVVVMSSQRGRPLLIYKERLFSNGEAGTVFERLNRMFMVTAGRGVLVGSRRGPLTDWPARR